MYIRAHTSLKSTSWRLKTESTYLKISEVIIRILLSMLRGGSSTASGMPVSELTKRDTWAIEASDVSSTPSVAETADEVTITKMSRPSTGPPLCVEARGKLDSQGDRMHGRRTMARILGRGYIRKLRITFLKQEMLSPTSFRYHPLDLQWNPTPAMARGRVSLRGC